MVRRLMPVDAMSPAIDDQILEGLVRVCLPRSTTGSPDFPSDGTFYACSIRSKFDIGGGGAATLRDRSVGLSESERVMAQERD